MACAVSTSGLSLGSRRKASNSCTCAHVHGARPCGAATAALAPPAAGGGANSTALASLSAGVCGMAMRRSRPNSSAHSGFSKPALRQEGAAVSHRLPEAQGHMQRFVVCTGAPTWVG